MGWMDYLIGGIVRNPDILSYKGVVGVQVVFSALCFLAAISNIVDSDNFLLSRDNNMLLVV